MPTKAFYKKQKRVRSADNIILSLVIARLENSDITSYIYDVADRIDNNHKKIKCKFMIWVLSQPSYFNKISYLNQPDLKRQTCIQNVIDAYKKEIRGCKVSSSGWEHVRREAIKYDARCAAASGVHHLIGHVDDGLPSKKEMMNKLIELIKEEQKI